MPPSYPLVLVEWLDHYELGPDWALISDLTPQIAVCFSVGWVIAETEDILSIVPHLSWDPDDDDPTGCSSQMNISKGSIRRRIPITVKKNEKKFGNRE